MSAPATGAEVVQYVTVVVAGQLFGITIDRVRDVFIPERVTRVPLARGEIAGVLNLRGRIVTAIDLRRRLHLPANAAGRPLTAVGIEYRGESYGLLIDGTGEVLALPLASREPNPVNLDPRWAAVSAGVHGLDGRLMVVLDVDRLLGAMFEAAA